MKRVLPFLMMTMAVVLVGCQPNAETSAAPDSSNRSPQKTEATAAAAGDTNLAAAKEAAPGIPAVTNPPASKP